MEFHVLGRLAAVSEGERKKIGGAKQRALLAVLIVQAGRSVSTDLLIDALHDDPTAASEAVGADVRVEPAPCPRERDRARWRSPSLSQPHRSSRPDPGRGVQDEEPLPV